MFKLILIIVILFSGTSLANGWEVISKMPEPVYGGQAVVHGDYIYIFGGFSDSLKRPVKTIQVFDPINNEWKYRGQMQHARYGFVADILNDSTIVYCGGMENGSNDVFSLERWNPYSDGPGNSLVQDSNSNFDRRFFTGHVFNENLYIFGGISTESAIDTIYQPYILRYNLSNRNTTPFQEELYEGTSLPYHHMSVRIDSIVYLLGGVHNNVSNHIQSFNLISHKLGRLDASLSGLRAGGAALNVDGEIYVLGGYNERVKALNTIEIFSLMENQVLGKSRMNFARKELMAAKFRDSIYVFGGKNEFDVIVPTVEKLAVVTTIERVQVNAPNDLELRDNYPNPFNATTTIKFDIKHPDKVTLNVYSIDGRLVKSLFSGFVPAGNHHFLWHGNDDQNLPVSSGIYLYRLVAGNEILTRKMVLVK
jgi:hypothetical protein